MQDGASNRERVVDLRVERQQSLGTLGHTERVLEQAMAIGVVHAQGGDGFVETLAVFFEDGLHRGAEAIVRDAADDAREVGTHLQRVVLGDRRQATHHGGIGLLGVSDGRERFHL